MEATIDFIFSPVVNYAMQQNHVPVIKRLLITNNSEADWRDILVEIYTEPNFAVKWKQHIDIIRKGETCELESIRLNIAAKFLAELTERVAGSITVNITSGETIIFKEDYFIDILAYDQWNGIGILPEMLAAFSTPNHPDIPKVIRSAATILGKWTGSPSFDEYQSRNPDRVRKQMAAIYEAISELQLLYVSVPASFEESGQRIRLADSIFINKIANCLDISLLYAACLEAIGLRPIVVITKGHAFVGAWLIAESFADPVNDDPSLLTKRSAAGINEIALMEATCMNAGKNVSFEAAEQAAAHNMANTAEFALFIDVFRVRFSGIRPLPLRIATPTGWEIVEETVKSRNYDAPAALEKTLQLTHSDKIEVSKQMLWERKLLDLTLRNNLLNLRVTKGTIQFITIDPAKLEDQLADGGEFQILAKPSDWDNPLRDAGIYQSLNAADPITDLVKQELLQRRVRTYLPERELTESVIQLYRSSRLALEENGVNTLYVALGFLKWFETPSSERPLYAPILLVPVDIIKKSALRGFVIKSREEETMINITLLEKIRQDFGITIGGLETLPKDDSGVDVKTIFNIVRQAIMSLPRWDVEEQALLGLFSFNKFLLWNDIHNNADKLSKHKMVASLISGKLEWEPGAENANVDFDSSVQPSDIALPISTDSSQFEAIISSSQNKSFVLHGPPGTGKSQTITNIIANALYAGKKVLFVAAKKAALDVVKTRLNAIGLSPFCLELHSNKAKKTTVLEQLKSATDVVKKIAPENYKSESDRLFLLRKELNDYVQALHRKYPFGFSLFDTFSMYSQFDVKDSNVLFSNEIISSLTELKVREWHDITEEMAIAAGIITHPHNHPFTGINVRQYTQQVKLEAKELLQQHLQLLNELKVVIIKVKKILGIEQVLTSVADMEMLIKIAGIMQELPDIPTPILAADPIEKTTRQIKDLSVHGRKRDAIRSKLLLFFQKSILHFSAEQTLISWNIASAKWFLPKWLEQSKILKLLRPFSKSGTIDKTRIIETLQLVIDYQAEQSNIDKAEQIKKHADFLWHDGECDWDGIDKACDSILALNESAAQLTGTSKTKDWRKDVAKQMGESSRMYVALHSKDLLQLTDLYQRAIKSIAAIQQKLFANSGDQQVITEVALPQVIAYTNLLLSNIECLKDWTAWTTIRNKAITAGLGALVDFYESGNIQTPELLSEYKKGLYHSCAEYIIEQHPILAAFNSMLFEEKIRKFKSLNTQFEKLTKDELYARLALKIPSFSQEAAQSSEIGILQKNIRNNGRALSLRKLFDSIPNLLPRLSPCMLMSPISVAQYFDTNSTKFDLVIFDEASQMPTCEAVGAIARATNVIVVGDPKQMPPTNFFSTNNIDEENIDKEDLESILDDCLALSMPSKHLLWHYRSKHESLIAFSNAKYYDNKLLTFPSNDDIATKVTYVHVPGYYDKGKTRQNKAEAIAIVAEIVRRLNDSTLSKRSIGVVTFSVVQQNLIDDLLTETFKLNPELEKIATESPEPLFIKNLENVQGDERDVILFSIGYGPDAEGKVSLNFGPLNREGGHRRLNVAVSRARYEMQVFATLRADQIDITRTASEGVAGVKSFLAYAEKGKIALPNRVSDTTSDNNAFENKLAEKIRAHGYEVHTGIGCSAYKVDIGIVNAANPSEYLLGILCDGKVYNAAKTASDREIVQRDVLGLLGWNIYRVWSAEWWEAPDKVMGGILTAIEKAIAQKQMDKVVLPLAELAPVVQQANVFLNTSYVAETDMPLPIVPRQVAIEGVVYEVCQISTQTAMGDEFLQPANRAKIGKQILDVLLVESPVSKSLLCRRVLAGWGISKLGVRINAHFESLFNQLGVKQVSYGKTQFLWKDDHDPSNYGIFRVSHDESQKRDAEDLPPEEVANGIHEILKHQISLPKPDLVREASRMFGYSRIGSNVEAAMLLGITAAINRGYVKHDNERIVIKDD